MEPRKANDLAGEVMRVLENTPEEVRFLIMHSLLGQAARWSFPQLDWEEGEDESKFVCPHCIMDLPSLKLLEYVAVMDDETETNVDNKVVYFDGSDLDADSQQIVICPECKLPVSLPRGWEHEWG